MKCAALLLLACAAARGQCLISGTVRDADSAKPLPRVHVFARPPAPPIGALSARAKPAILRVTGDAGGFCFDKLEPGVYTLVAQHAGYLESLYGARPGHSEGATAFTVDGREALPPVAIRMVAGATLSGTVLDDRGQPAENVMVDVQRKIWDLIWEPSHVSATRTGPGGVFRIPLVAPGTYYLATEPLGPPQPGDPFYEGPMLDEKGRPLVADGAPTFYSGSYTFAHATPIAVKAGQQIDNLLLAMKPRVSRRIAGRLAVALDPKALREAEVIVSPVIEVAGQRFHSGAIHPDGTFAIADLGPVEYEVTVDGLAVAFSAKIDLSNGDLEGLILEPLRTVSLRVTGRPSAPDGPVAGVLAMCNIEIECATPVQPDGKSVYQFSGLRPGLYRFHSRDGAAYVKSVTVDGRPLGDAPLDLRKGVPESVAVVMSGNLASLAGSIEHSERQTPGLGVSVLLVNEIRFTPEVSNNFVAADHAGRFHFEGVMPGKYRVLAIEGFDDGPWGSPELFALLRDKSVAVEIGEGESRTATAPVVPVAEWEAALRKLGM